MKDNKIVSSEITISNGSEVKISSTEATYNPDGYLDEYFFYDDALLHDEKCYSCKHWLGYECSSTTGSCNYESFEFMK